MDSASTITPRHEKLSFKVKFFYGIGSFGSYTLFTVFLGSVIIYYRDKLLIASDTLFWAFLFYTILNAINGVLFGWLSDRTKTQHGRRLPFLRFLAPFLALTFILIWISPSKTEISEGGVLIWLVISMVLFDICYTSTNMAYSALGQELSMDNTERTKIQVFIMIFGIISVFISLLIPLSLLKNYGRTEFIYFTIILAIVQLATMWITAFSVKERLEFSQIDTPLPLKTAFLKTVKNKSFLTVVVVNFAIQFVQAALFGNIFFYITYVFMDFDSTLVLGLIAGCLLTGLIFGILYTLRITRTKGVKAALTRSLFFVGIGLILVGSLPDLVAITGFLLFGLGLFGIMALINVAYGAVADEDEVKTGTRREAAIFGINALITKPAQSLAGAFITFMLFAFLYHEPIGGVPQPQTAYTLLGMRLAIGVIPGFIILISLLIFKHFPLYGSYLTAIKTTMFKLHKKKRAQLKAHLAS
ncbi:MAG: MFS transporter [Candidatus Helarchaeota archaeon]